MKSFRSFLSIGLMVLVNSQALAKTAPPRNAVKHFNLDNLSVDMNLLCTIPIEDKTESGPALTTFIVHHVKGEVSTKRQVTIRFYNEQLPADLVLTNPISSADFYKGSGSQSGRYVLVGGGPAKHPDGTFASDKLSFRLVISYTPEGRVLAGLDVTSKEISFSRKSCSIPPPPLPMDSKQ